MTGASIETTLELWASSLREVKKRIGPLFAQERAALNAGLFVDGLLGDERRKTGWMRAEAAGDPGPWRQQALLGRDRWDADALRDLVRDYVTEHLADQNAVLVIDETGFLKQGKASCGVARQYTGSAGKITNCQIGVFAAYVSRHGHAFIDRALYLPKGWTDDPARLKAAYVPDDVGFSTKPRLAGKMMSAPSRRACRSAGLRPIPSMASAISSGTCAAPAKAMCSASIPIIGLHHGASRNGWLAAPRRSPKHGNHPTGGVCRPVRAPKDHGCMTGATSNWPISRVESSTMKARACGHADC
jgi:hypothetical protein